MSSEKPILMTPEDQFQNSNLMMSKDPLSALFSKLTASSLTQYGFFCTIHEINVEVFGSFRMSFQNFSTGNDHSFGGEYIEIKPNEFLKYTDKFDDPNLPEEMITAVLLRKTIVGTEIKITQDGIPAVIPTEMCYLGWQVIPKPQPLLF